MIDLSVYITSFLYTKPIYDFAIVYIMLYTIYTCTESPYLCE